MAVHSRAIISIERFWHKGGSFSVCEGSVLDDVLKFHHIVACCLQSIKAIIDFVLPAGAHFVMLPFNLKAYLLAKGSHLIAQIHYLVIRWDGEISSLDARLIA